MFATRVINRIAPPTIAKNAIHSRTRRQSMLLLQRVIDALGVVHRLLLHGGFEAPRALERVARISVARLVDELVALDPRHHRTKLFADLLDRMLRREPAIRVQRRRAGAILEYEILGVVAALDSPEGVAHRLLGGGRHDLRSR